ncbi:Cationic amino acid transporter 9, partial [Durusdinium trenchii]
YIAFSIVLVGIIPYDEIDSAAPAEDAFGKHYANIPWALMLVNWGAVIGLFTTLITGLYSQARIYLAMARDGLFFQAFGRVSPTFGTPIHAQWLCGAIAALLACVPVDKLALFLSIGVLLSYTVVCAGVLVLRAESPEQAAKWSGLVTLAAVAASLCSSYILSSKNYLAIAATAVFALLAMLCWVPFFQVPYSRPSTFACPGCPTIPLFGLTINGYLLSQCHWQAWLRLVLTSFLILGAYALRVRKSLKTPGQTADRSWTCCFALLWTVGSMGDLSKPSEVFC